MSDDAFIYSGYSNWKNASGKTGGFSCHERSKTALEIVVSLPKTTKDVGEMLSSTYTQKEKRIRSQY